MSQPPALHLSERACLSLLGNLLTDMRRLLLGPLKHPLFHAEQAPFSQKIILHWGAHRPGHNILRYSPMSVE